MNTKTHNSEKGQAIIFLILGLTVFLGFVALAVDGGMVLSNRRNVQNGADAAALAGAGKIALEFENRHVLWSSFSCTANNVTTSMQLGRSAAITRAANNNFSIFDPPQNNNGVSTSCVIWRPSCIVYDKYVDVTVQISSQTQTSFARVLFPNAITNRLSTVVRVRPRQPLVFGAAIAALNPANCQGQGNGATFRGSSEVRVTGGAIYSQGCMRSSGQPYVHVTGGWIDYNGQFIPGNANWSPYPYQLNYDLPASNYDVPLPDCSDPRAHNVATLPSVLTPGLWCLSGDLTLNGNNSVVGTEVTIYIPNGSVSINGNSYLNLTAPSRDVDHSPAINGLVIYMPKSNHHTLSINGNSNNHLTGTVLVPGGTIDLDGTGDTSAYHSQFIGWNVQVGGNAALGIVYSEDMVYSKPTSIEVAK